MDFSIELWIQQYTQAVQRTFSGRIWLVGLQGSYGRGEATAQSDIDVVLVLDELSIADLRQYRTLLDALPQRERVCGFVSGREELLSWEPSDLFQFCHDTTPIVGSLEDLLSRVHQADVLRAVHTGACNLYHMCVHNLVHAQSLEVLQGLYKSAVFVLQAIAFLQTGIYARQKKDLHPLLRAPEQQVLQAALEIREGKEFPPDAIQEYSGLLFHWAAGWIKRCSAGTWDS